MCGPGTGSHYRRVPWPGAMRKFRPYRNAVFAVCPVCVCVANLFRTGVPVGGFSNFPGMSLSGVGLLGG